MRYRIKYRHSYYNRGPEEWRWLLTEQGYPRVFATKVAAQREVDKLDGTVYYQDNNEYSRPEYVAVPVEG